MKAGRLFKKITAAVSALSMLSIGLVMPTASAAGNTVYIDESFSYEDQTIIKSAGNDVAAAPDPVTLGKLTYQAGRRNNGLINDYAKIDAGKLVINATSYSANGRGVMFTFADAAVPSVSELGSGQVLEMSFDVMTGGTFEATGFGALTTADLTTKAVKARVILDKEDSRQVLIVSDENGNVINSRVETLSASTLSGMSFRSGAAWVEIDNLKVETKSRDYGIVTFGVMDSSNAAVGGAAIKITDSYSITTASDGTAAAALPNGSYNTEASKAGYTHSGSAIDSHSQTVKVSSDSRSISYLLDLFDYEKIPETVNITGGQPFIAAPKTSAPNTTPAFAVSVIDQNNIEMGSDEYDLEWHIYKAGTDVTDPAVTIDQNGVVSVEQSFYTEGGAEAFDVVAIATANNAGLRSCKGTAALMVGNGDVIYCEAADWEQAAGTRTGSKDLASAVTLGDTTEITLDLNMQEPEGQRTIFLLGGTTRIVGLQYQVGGNITVGTGWSGNSAYNQSDDTGKFKNQETLVTGYTSGSKLQVKFAIDKTTNKITVSSGGNTVTLDADGTIPSKFTGFVTGLYRNDGAMTLSKVMVKVPDPNYLAISGDRDFAKVGGAAVERTYSLTQSVPAEGETFTWSVEPTAGVAMNNGVLSVTDAAAAGSYTITAASTSNAEKTASITVEIGDFQSFGEGDVVISGEHAFNLATDSGARYAITSAVDKYGDDVAGLLTNIKWTSSDASVAQITADGVLSFNKAGSAVITAAITNGTAVSTFTVPITVGIYSIAGDAEGDTTTVTDPGLVTSGAVAGYQITTAKDGKLVSQEIVSAIPQSIDTSGADRYEIAPVYEAKNITKSNPVTIDLPAGTYNFKLSGASGDRFDVYVNDQMLANNMLQGGSAVTGIDVNDVVVSEGYAKINLRDYPKTPTLGKAQIVKSPSIVDRKKKVYVLGDSLVCIYANGGNSANNYQTGLGQVLGNYLTDDVETVDLGNSGVIAEGLAATAITQVAISGKPGDIMILESGYNDRSYSTQPNMKAALVSMYDAAVAAGVTPIFMTPPASAHDYKSDVSWSGVMRSTATELEVQLLDLAQVSYDFFNETYGSSFSEAEVYSVYNVNDRLHSTFKGANKMASLVAAELVELGYGAIVNTGYEYSFVDSQGRTIDCKVEGRQPEVVQTLAGVFDEEGAPPAVAFTAEINTNDYAVEGVKWSLTKNGRTTGDVEAKGKLGRYTNIVLGFVISIETDEVNAADITADDLTVTLTK